MRIDSRIAVIGTDNQIGISICNLLKKKKYKKLSIFNFSKNKNEIKKFFLDKKPEYIFLSQGKSGGIWTNQLYPVELMLSNLNVCLNILPLANEYKVKKLLYFASSCIYPKNITQPSLPNQIMSDYLEPTNIHYAIAKIAGIHICDAYNKQYKTNFVSIIPSNHYGPGDDFNQKNSHVIAALISKMHAAKKRDKKKVIIWGTGRPIRDFIFIEDLASASLHIMKNYKSKNTINISSGDTFSIKEIAYLVKETVGYKGDLIFDHSKGDGVLYKILDNTEIKKLGWKNKYNIKDALKMTYIWYKKNVD